MALQWAAGVSILSAVNSSAILARGLPSITPWKIALDNALEDALDNGGGFLVQNPFLAVVRVVQIAVGECAGDVLSRRRPRAENRPYLPAGISGVPLRKDVSEGHEIVLALGGVDALGHGDQPDAPLPKLLQKQPHAQVVAAQSAHVFNQDLAHIAALDVLHNLQKSGPVPACAAPPVIRPVDNIGKAVPGRVFLQVLLLMLNGQGFIFPPVLMA